MEIKRRNMVENDGSRNSDGDVPNVNWNDDKLKVSGTHLPDSRVDKRVKSYYLAALDNGLMITKKL